MKDTFCDASDERLALVMSYDTLQSQVINCCSMKRLHCTSIPSLHSDLSMQTMNILQETVHNCEVSQFKDICQSLQSDCGQRVVTDAAALSMEDLYFGGTILTEAPLETMTPG